MALDPAVQAALNAAESVVVGAEDAAQLKDKDRSMIARWIVIGFISIIAGLLVFVLAGVIGEYAWPNNPPKWKEGATLIKEVLSSVLLPVVTLVIGFYFGVEKKP